MVDDWLIAKIDNVEQAAEAVRAVLGRAREVLEPARQERLAGRSLIEIARDLSSRGAGTRSATASAYRGYEHAVLELRAAVVRALVDEEGLTLAQLAEAMGVTRQTVTRLYKAGNIESD